MNKYTNGIDIVVEDANESIDVEVSDFQQVTTSDYEQLRKLPRINDIVLIGNKNSGELGLVDQDAYEQSEAIQNQAIGQNAKDLNDFKLKTQQEQVKQDEAIGQNTTNLETFKIETNTKQQSQDKSIEENANGISQINKDISSYKLQIQLEQEEQDKKINANSTNLNEYKAQIQAEQEAQNTSIEQNATNLNAFKEQVKKEQAKQDESISNNAKSIEEHKSDYNTFKEAVSKEQQSQNQNIQANSLAIQSKVDQDAYNKAELTQNQLIEANKNANAKTNETLELYKQETAQGFQDERDLSSKEHQEAIDLANTKAKIDDINLSSETTFSSLESAERFTCEKTYQGEIVTIKPIEDYPMSIVANIEAVQQESGAYSGWDNVEVVQDNGGTHKAYNQNLTSTCYGGTFNFKTGDLTKTSDLKLINGQESGWDEIKLTNGRKHQFALKNYISNASNDLSKQKCNKYAVPSVMPTLDFNGVWIKDNVLYVGSQIADAYDTLQDWLAYLLKNPFQIIYGFEKAQVENYKPQLIKGQIGINKLYANSGNIIVTTHVLPLCDGDVDESVSGIKLNGVLQLPDSDKVVNLEVITDGQVDVKIAQAISKIKTLQFQVVDMLPSIGESNIIYLVPIKARKDNNGYTEWAYINNQWELLGSTEIDLSNYLQKSDILEIEGQASDKTLSQKYVTAQLKLRITNEALTTILENYATLEKIQNLVTREDVINDDVVQDSSAYSSKKIEQILKSPQYNLMVVQVSPRGIGQYQADKTANEIKQHIDGGGLAILKHENQVYEYQKYDNNDAVFFRVDINESKAEKTDIRVQYDKNIVVKSTQLNKVAEADNSIKLNGMQASDYVLNVDIADVSREPIENVVSANTQLIRGWYKTTVDTTNLPFDEPKENKVGFLRVLEQASKHVLQVFYCMPLNSIYLRTINDSQVGKWKLLPNETKVEEIITSKNYQNEQQVNALIESALEKIPFAEGGSF